jgi:hypothetical protein
MEVLLLLPPLAAAAATSDTLHTTPLLFMDTADAYDRWGLVYPVTTPLAPLTTPTAATPASEPTTSPIIFNLNLTNGGLLAAFDPNPTRSDAGYEVFYINATTPTTSAVYFGTTIDFTTLSTTAPPVLVANIGVVPDSSPNISCYPKTVGRSADGKKYSMMMFCESHGTSCLADLLLKVRS